VACVVAVVDVLVLATASGSDGELDAAVVQAATSSDETGITTESRRRMGSVCPGESRASRHAHDGPAPVHRRVEIAPPAGHTLITPRMFGMPGCSDAGSFFVT